MQAAVGLTEEFVEIGIDEEFVKLDALDEVVDEIKELEFEDKSPEDVEKIEEELKLLNELDIETTVELDEKFTVLLDEL